MTEPKVYNGVSAKGFTKKGHYWFPDEEDVERWPNNEQLYEHFKSIFRPSYSKECYRYADFRTDIRSYPLSPDNYVAMDALLDAFKLTGTQLESTVHFLRNELTTSESDEIKFYGLKWLPSIYSPFPEVLRLMSFSNFVSITYLQMRKFYQITYRSLFDFAKRRYKRKNHRILFRFHIQLRYILCILNELIEREELDKRAEVLDSMPDRLKRMTYEAEKLKNYIIVNTFIFNNSYYQKVLEFFIKNYWHVSPKFLPAYLRPPRPTPPEIFVKKYGLQTTDSDTWNVKKAPDKPEVLLESDPTVPMYHSPCAFKVWMPDQLMIPFYDKSDTYSVLYNFKIGTSTLLKSINLYRQTFEEDFKLKHKFQYCEQYSWLPVVPKADEISGKVAIEYKTRINFRSHLAHLHRIFLCCATCLDVLQRSCVIFPDLTYKWYEVFYLWYQYTLTILCRLQHAMVTLKTPWFSDIDYSFVPSEVVHIENNWQDAKDRQVRFFYFISDCAGFANDTISFILRYPIMLPAEDRPDFCNEASEELPPDHLKHETEVLNMHKIPFEQRKNIINMLEEDATLSKTGDSKDVVPKINVDIQELPKEAFAIIDGKVYFHKPMTKQATPEQKKLLKDFLDKVPRHEKPCGEFVSKEDAFKRTIFLGSKRFDLLMLIDSLYDTVGSIKNIISSQLQDLIQRYFRNSSSEAISETMALKWLPEVPKIDADSQYIETLFYLSPKTFFKKWEHWCKIYACGVYMVLSQDVWMKDENIPYQQWAVVIYHEICHMLCDTDYIMAYYDIEVLHTFKMGNIPKRFYVLSGNLARFRDLSILLSLEKACAYARTVIEFLLRHFWLIQPQYLPGYALPFNLNLPAFLRNKFDISVNDYPEAKVQEAEDSHYRHQVPLWYWPRFDSYKELEYSKINDPSDFYEHALNAFYALRFLKEQINENELEIFKKEFNYTYDENFWYEQEYDFLLPLVFDVSSYF